MSRIYVVTTTVAAASEGVITEIRLVNADNPSQARNYVTRSTVNVRYAEQRDLADLLTNGYRVEDATDPAAPQPTLPGV